jgi:anti-sigma B factor antagonist
MHRTAGRIGDRIPPPLSQSAGTICMPFGTGLAADRYPVLDGAAEIPERRPEGAPVSDPSTGAPCTRPAGLRPTELELRLHAPSAHVVLLRVDGELCEASALTLAACANRQLRRSPHLVLDLSGVTFLAVRGLGVLLRLHEQAAAVGSRLHVAAPHHAVRRPMQVSGLDRVVATAESAEMAIACLPRRRRAPVGS